VPGRGRDAVGPEEVDDARRVAVRRPQAVPDVVQGIGAVGGHAGERELARRSRKNPVPRRILRSRSSKGPAVRANKVVERAVGAARAVQIEEGCAESADDARGGGGGG
jgi:hypothetical protein